MTLPVVVVASEEAVRELPIPPWSFGVIALLVFALLLGLTWSFRGTAQKYARPDGASHGAESPIRSDDGAGTTSSQPQRPEPAEHRN
ncbi:MAG: hypothetical protein ACRCYX_11395 [Dermatophilaceae bacterium]